MPLSTTGPHAAPPVLLVWCGDAENALLNLCIDARDAMASGGGRLTVATANVRLDDRGADGFDLPPGESLAVSVTDTGTGTGTGMSAEVAARAFDPFFTTKPLGRGTGLGLSMVYGFAPLGRAATARTIAGSRSMTVCMPHRSRRTVCLAALGLALPWRARAGLDFWTGEYTASQSELQAIIARQFPRSQRYAEIVRVTLSDPQLGLDPAANRAAVTARVSIASPLIGGGPVDGSVSLSSALRYDAAARALRLEQPRADRLALQGVSGADAERLQQIGGLVAQELLRGQVLRTFTAEELSFGRKTYEIGDITVLADGIKVQLK